MTDLNGPNFSVNKISFQSLQKSNQDTAPVELPQQEDTPQLKDFSDPKAETIGRSMLFKGADDTHNDLKILLENPEVAENSDELFETAYKAAELSGSKNPYEEAASFATGNIRQ